METGETAQWVRTLAILTGDMALFPSTDMVAYDHSYLQSQEFSCVLMVSGIHVSHIHKCN